MAEQHEFDSFEDAQNFVDGQEGQCKMRWDGKIGKWIVIVLSVFAIVVILFKKGIINI